MREVRTVLRSVLSKTLWDQRRSLTWWAVGLLAVVAVYVLPYQQYLDQGALNINTDSGLYQALGFDTSPAGYLQGTMFGLLGPLLLIMAAVVAGARAVAGDKETGLLDLLLAHPVSRSRLLWERFGALAVTTAWLGLVAWVGTVAATGAADMGIGTGNLAAAVAGMALLALGFGTLALAAGAVSGRRGLVLGVTAALAVAAYLVHAIAPQISELDGLKRLSPFYYFIGGDPLRTGFDLGHLAVLAVIPLVLLGVALVALNRRDIAT
jgi:ABC-2 type transport system permease protein